MKNIINVYEQDIDINVNLLNVIDESFFQSNYESNEEIKKALNFDYDIMNVYYNDNITANVTFIKKNKKGCTTLELTAYCEYYEHKEYNEKDELCSHIKVIEISKDDLYEIEHEEKDYKYSFNESDINKVISNFDISELKKYKNVIGKLKEEGFFNDENNKEMIESIKEYQKQISTFFKEFQDI